MLVKRTVYVSNKIHNSHTICKTVGSLSIQFSIPVVNYTVPLLPVEC